MLRIPRAGAPLERGTGPGFPRELASGWGPRVGEPDRKATRGNCPNRRNSDRNPEAGPALRELSEPCGLSRVSVRQTEPRTWQVIKTQFTETWISFLRAVGDP